MEQKKLMNNLEICRNDFTNKIDKDCERLKDDYKLVFDLQQTNFDKKLEEKEEIIKKLNKETEEKNALIVEQKAKVDH